MTVQVTRYRGKVASWDVVNEVLAEDGTLADTFWPRRLGPGYIADAFRWAHQADPKARLYLNEYDLETSAAKRAGALDLVTRLRRTGVPVHGVGVQAHLSVELGLPAELAGALRRFSDSGFDVAITELDVRMVLPATSRKLAAQAAIYQGAFDACARARRCVEFTTWGFTDRHSWIPEFLPGQGAAPDAETRVPEPGRQNRPR
ncbi:hypothetical protein GCM10010160_35690 [Acrocarpospora corrugata]